jgi:hypothetical protein
MTLGVEAVITAGAAPRERAHGSGAEARTRPSADGGPAGHPAVRLGHWPPIGTAHVQTCPVASRYGPFGYVGNDRCRGSFLRLV